MHNLPEPPPLGNCHRNILGHSHWNVRAQQHKLVRFRRTSEYEFYDLKKDPFEMNNVARQTGYKSAITETGQLLEKLVKQVDIKPEQIPGAKKK